jgi:hypothetical protein
MHGRRPDLAFPVLRAVGGGAGGLIESLGVQDVCDLGLAVARPGRATFVVQVCGVDSTIGSAPMAEEVRFTMRTVPAGQVLLVASKVGRRCSVRTQCAR